MSIKSIIKAGLLTASLVAIAAPTLARPDDDSRPERGARGNGGGNENRGNRGGDNGGGDRGSRGGDSWRGGESRPAPAPAPSPVVRTAPPVATPAADNPRFQRGGNEQPRPGTQQWYGQRGITPPPPTPARNNAAPDRGREQAGWQANGGRDRGNNDGRNGNWNRDRSNDGRNDRDNNWNRDRDGRDNNWRGNDGRNDRDNNWNRDRDGRDNNWRGNDNRGSWNNGRPGARPPVANRWDGMRRWDNNGWRNDRRYDWRDWRNSHRSIFRLPSYRAPYGWNRSYSRFSIGIYLDSLLFGPDYWIDDPWTYRLPPVYGTLRWVRYYDDALLIDIRDGYVVDVIYDFFW